MVQDRDRRERVEPEITRILFCEDQKIVLLSEREAHGTVPYGKSRLRS